MLRGMRDDTRASTLEDMTTRKHRFTVSLDDSARALVEKAAAERDVPVATWLAHAAQQEAIRQALAQPEPILSAEDELEVSELRVLSGNASREHLGRLDREGYWD